MSNPALVMSETDKKEVELQAVSSLEDRVAELERINMLLRAECQELIRSKTETQAENALLREVFDRSPFPTMVMDEQMRLTAFNRAAAQAILAMLGRTPVLGASAFDYAFPRDLESLEAAVSRALANKVTTINRRVGDPERSHWYQHTFIPVVVEGMSFRGVVLTSLSVENQRRAEEALRQTERHLSELTDSLLQPVFEMSPDGRVVYANRAAREAFGYTAEDIENGVMVMDVIAPEDRDRVWKDVQRVLNGNSYEPNEYVVQRKDGSQFPAVFYGAAILTEGRPTGVRGIILDISRMKLAEEEIRKLSKVVETSPQGIVITDPAGTIEYANASAAREIGVGEVNDLLGRSLFDLAEEASAGRLRNEVVPQLLKGQSWSGTIDLRHHDHTPFPVDVVCACIPDREGRPQHLSVIFHDVSKSREAERALRESEQRFRSMADTAPVLIWMAGVDRYTYYFNRTWLNFTGRSLSQEYGKGWMSGIHPEDLNRCQEAYRGAFASRQPFHVEYRLKNADGSYHWVLDTGQPRFTSDGSLSGYIGSCIDISERKRAEDAMAESERRHRSLYNHTPVMLHSIDRDGRLLSVSDYWLKVLGYTRREVLGRPSTDFLTQASREYARQVVLPRFFQEGVCYEIPYQMVKKNGEIIDVLLSATAERDAEGAVVRSLAVVVDVTERKRAEQALREKTAEVSAILEALPDLYFHIDREGRIHDFHAPRLDDLFVEPEKFVGRPYADCLPAEVTQKVDSCRAEVQRTGQIASFEYQLPIRGELRDYESRMVPLENESVILLVRNITDRKRSEARIAQLNECFLSFGPDPVANINLLVAVCGQLLGATCALYNRRDGEYLETVGGWNIPADFNTRDRPEGHLCTDVIRGSTDALFVVRDLPQTTYLQSDPNVDRYGLQTYVGKVVNYGGEAVGSLCLVYQRDFEPDAETERIMGIIAAAIAVEESRRDILRDLQESDERFRAIANYTYNWENWVDDHGRLVWVNPGVERITGYTAEECMAMSDFPAPLIHPEDSVRMQKELSRALAGERGNDVEFRIVRKDGGIVWVSASWQPIFDNAGVSLGYRSSIRDISAYRRAQEMLLASERRYRLVTEQTGQMVYDWDVESGQIHWSGAIEQITGFTNEEYSLVDIKAWEEMIHPDDRLQSVEALDDAARGSGRFEVVYRLRRKDGSYVYVEDNGVFIKDENGRAVRMFGTMKNITERRQAEEALLQSEESYRGLFNSVAEAIYIQDAEGKFLDVNQGAVEMYGYPREYFIGKTPEFLSAPDLNDMHATIEKVRRAFAGEPQRFEWWGRRANGEIFPKDVRLYPGTYFGQQVIIAWAMDITDRKTAERAVRESEERYRVLAETAFDGIAICENGILQFASDRFAQIFGYETSADLLHRPIMDLIAPQERQRMQDYIQSVNALRCETVCLRRDGAQFPAEVCGRTILQDSKEIRISAVRDLTERQRMDEALRARSRLEATAILAGGIAHDFNNLMAAVLGNAELLSVQFGDRPEAQEMLDVISRTALRAGELAQQMLAFARGGKYQPQLLNLNDSVTQILRLQERTLPPRLHLERQLQPSLWIVEADPNQMSQVLLNLVTNSVEATQGMGRITIETRNVEIDQSEAQSSGLLTPGPYVVLSVSDTGCGMPPEVREHVFEPFFSTKAQGRGLGLAAAYGIVHNHGGQITVESKVGQGTTFSILLPAKPSATVRSASVPSTAPALPPGSETILIADDEEAILEVIEGFFGRLGYRVLTARDGAEAIECFDSHANDIELAILDLAMPAYTGVEVYQHMKSANPCVRVVFSSGFDVDDHTRELLDAGDCVFVQKPFQLASLARQTRALLDSKHDSAR